MTENMTDRDLCVVLATCDTLIDHLQDEIKGELDRKLPTDTGGFIGATINQTVTIDTLRRIKKQIESLRLATAENRAKLAKS
jgi:hypothetical protein